MGKNRRAIYSADTWHVDDGTGTDGGERYHKSPVLELPIRFTPPPPAPHPNPDSLLKTRRAAKGQCPRWRVNSRKRHSAASGPRAG